jgi:cell division septation protein DedD
MSTGKSNFVRQRQLRATLRRVLLVGALVLCPVSGAVAQQETASKEVVAAIVRARALLDNGDGATARTTMDSLVSALPSGSIDLAEALHWRAVMAESIVDAEKDWKRLLVEVPLAERAADALLRLSELEALRGQHANSRQHAERLLLDHAASPNRARALLLLAKGWINDNHIAKGCTALTELRPLATTGELKLQSDELQPRCANIAAVPKSAAPASKTAVTPPVTQPPTAPKPTQSSTRLPKDSAPPVARVDSTATGQFSVQLAAYDRIADANAMVKRLAALNIVARVDGKAAPFRVRTGRFETRAEAATALAELVKRGIKGFVAELAP